MLDLVIRDWRLVVTLKQSECNEKELFYRTRQLSIQEKGS